MRRTILAYLVPGAALYLISNGNVAVPIAAWLAPVGLLRFSRAGAPAPGQALLFAVILLATYPMLYGIIPPFLGALAFGLTAYYALLVYLPYLADRLIAPRLRGFAATLVFPCAATAVDYLAGASLGTWNSAAYTQYGNLPLVQLASVTGMWGITFLIFWTAAVANWAWDRKFEPRRVAAGVLALAAVLGAAHLYGGLRLAAGGSAAATVPAAAIAESRQDVGATSIFELLQIDPERAAHVSGTLVDDLLALSGEAADRGARLVLWAETVVSVPEAREAALQARAAALARERGIYLALAYFTLPPDFPATPGRNKSVLIGPSGQRLWDYSKARLVPGAPEIVGDGVIPRVVTPAGATGTAICYDMDFPDLIGSAGPTDLMLVPAWDWRAIDPLHAHMAVFRAVENGFNMLRATGEGLSIACDAHGRTLARMDAFTAGQPKLMLVHLPTRGVWTFYSVAGDWFPWAALAALAVLAVLAVTGARRKPTSAGCANPD